MIMSTGGVQRLISTKPRALTATEPKAPARPRAVTPSGLRSTSRVTPTSPTRAAPTRTRAGRSPIIGQARAITASGEVAWIVAARPPGRW